MHSRINSAELAAIQDTLGVQFTLDAYCEFAESSKTLAQIDFATSVVHQADHFKYKTQQERLLGCILPICTYPKLRLSAKL